MGHNERGSAVTRAAAAGGWSRSLCTPRHSPDRAREHVAAFKLERGASSSNFSSSQKMDRAIGRCGAGRRGALAAPTVRL